MKHRVCVRLAIGFVGCLLGLGLATVQAKAETPDRISDVTIWKMIIRDSIAAYKKSCPCPYSADRLGQRCGANSAYARETPAAPMCYPQDIPDEQIALYRAKLQYRAAVTATL